MKIFVTGANGLIGGAVARAAVSAGHEVYGLVRSEAGARTVTAARAQPVLGDLASPEGFTREVAHVDAVVHTAVGAGGRVTDLDHRAVAAMLSALSGRRSTFILTSGLGVYAGIHEPVIDEDFPLDDVRPAQAPRVGLERLVLAAADRTRSLVLRPANVYGQGRAGLFTRRLLDEAKQRQAGVYVGDGGGWYSAVHVDDLAAAYIAALTSDVDGCFNLASQHVILRELAGAVSHAIGRGGATHSLSQGEADEAFGPLALTLGGASPVQSLRATSELRWRPDAPSLIYELVHGTLAERTPNVPPN